MERVLKISYNWTNNDNESGEVLEHHKEYLEESAFDRIGYMMKQGYTSGELSDNLHSQEDPADHEGTSYSGWWSVSKEDS